MKNIYVGDILNNTIQKFKKIRTIRLLGLEIAELTIWYILYAVFILALIMYPYNRNDNDPNIYI